MVYRLANKVAALERSATDEVDNTVKRMKRDGIDDIVSLGGGEPCFDTPLPVQDAAVAALRAGKTKYEPTQGDYKLREEICRKLKRDNAIEVEVEDVVVTPGGKFAIYLVFQALLEEGDSIMILDPAWVSYESAAKLAGADLVRIPSTAETGFQPDLDAVRAAMDDSVRCLVVNSPCNPTGAVYSRETLRELTQIARDHGALVVSDEIYEYVIYEGEHYSPGSEFDNVVTVNSFSKSYAMTGWRLGYMTAPSELVEGVVKIYQHSATCVNAFAQAGATEALRDPKAWEASQRMMRGYLERAELTTELLQRSPYFDYEMPQGAFYAFPSYTFEMPSLQLATELLEEAHVATVPGIAFGDCGEGHLRLSYSTTKENLVEAFERMDAYLDERL